MTLFQNCIKQPCLPSKMADVTKGRILFEIAIMFTFFIGMN
jgi:hypothetical protein